MNFNLQNKKVLITGSSGGIGKAISKKFIDMEAKMIFTSSNKENLNNLKNLFGSDNIYYHLPIYLRRFDLENRLSDISTSN